MSKGRRPKVALVFLGRKRPGFDQEWGQAMTETVRACASKMDCLDAIHAEGLRLNNEMSGHPSMAQYTDQGYEIITF